MTKSMNKKLLLIILTVLICSPLLIGCKKEMKEVEQGLPPIKMELPTSPPNPDNFKPTYPPQ
jgi:hypothetical protein